MPVVVGNFEVFVLTRNRASLLQQAIQSLLRQTATGFPITILDNASTDRTAEVVASFRHPGLHLITAEKDVGFLLNLQKCQKLATREYVMLFHDDDQLHPSYLEIAMRYLTANPDAVLAVSNAKNIPVGASPVIPRRTDTSAVKLDRGLFATALYIRNKIAFCSVIYRTEYFKALQLTELSDRFGKWRDRPVMIEAVQDRTAIILNGAFVYSGRHPEQDTHTKETHPPYTLWLNREGYYRGILGDRLSRFTGLGFCIMSHRHLKSGYKRRIVKTIDFATYLREAFALGATTRKAWMSRWLAPRLVQIAYSFFARAYFKVHHRVGLPAA